MSRSGFLGAIFLAFGLAAVQAQTQSSISPAPTSKYVQTSKIVGMKVRDSNGESVGTIKDVIFDRDSGSLLYAVISTGDSATRLTGTTKTVAVPWAVFSQGSDPTAMTLTVDRERVYAAPAFEYSRINEYSTNGYVGSIYSYYGIQPNVRTTTKENSEIAVSTPSPVATQTPAALPTVSATPAPSVLPTSTPTPSRTPLPPTPTPMATPTPPSTAETTTPTPSDIEVPESSSTPSATVSPTATARPQSSWAGAAARRATATPSPTAKERKPQPPGEGPSPSRQIRRYTDRRTPTATPKPTPKRTTW